MTGQRPAQTLDDLLRENPDAPALRNEAGTVSRGELRAAAAAMAGELSALGLESGDAIGIWLPEGPAWIQVLLAAARLDLFLVPLSTRYTEREATHALSVAQARAIITTASFLGIDFADMTAALRRRMPRIEHTLFIADPRRLHRPDGLVADVEPDADTAARNDPPLACFSTSGTTGLPKLAPHGQASIARHAVAAARAFDLRADDQMLCALPFYGVFGFMTVLSALAAGASCRVQPVFDAGQALGAFTDGVTHFIGADAMYDAIFEAPDACFPKFRRGGIADFVGRAAHWVPVLEQRLGARISGLYGSSECYALMAVRDPQAPAAERARSGGRVVDPEIEISVRDPRTDAACAIGEAGELWLRGPNVMPGYVNNPQASERAFDEQGWFRTGDLCSLDSADTFTYYARLGDGLRLRGYLVDPAEIERWLCEHPGIAAAQVVGVHRTGEGDRAVAFVLPAEGVQADPPAWDAHCRQGLAPFKRPSRIVAVEAFPVIYGPNGTKIQKAVLREQAAALLAATDRSRARAADSPGRGPGSRHHLARVEPPVRIERAFDVAHQIDRDRIAHPAQRMAFGRADPVLGGNAAVQIHGQVLECSYQCRPMGGEFRRRHRLRAPYIEMDVAIANVAERHRAHRPRWHRRAPRRARRTRGSPSRALTGRSSGWRDRRRRPARCPRGSSTDAGVDRRSRRSPHRSPGPRRPPRPRPLPVPRAARSASTRSPPRSGSARHAVRRTGVASRRSPAGSASCPVPGSFRRR
ncbi:MAG: AMP-binding protein [Burkholderiaceae bacterium]